MFTTEFKNTVRRKAAFVGGMFAGALTLLGICTSCYAIDAARRFGVDWWTNEDEPDTTEEKEEVE